MNTLRFFGIFLFGLILASCGDKPASTVTTKVVEYAPGTFTLIGTVTNQKNPQIQLISQGQRISVPVQNGAFKYTAELKQPAVGMLRHGRLQSELYMKPGATLNISFDDQNALETVVFTGEGAAENTYYLSKSKVRTEWSRTNNQLFNAPYAEYKTATNQLRDQLIAVLDTEKSNLKDKHFIAMENGNINAEVCNSELSYPYMYSRVNNGEKAELGDDYLAFAKNIPLDNPQILSFDNVRSFVGQYIHYNAEQKLDKNAKKYGADAPLLKAKLESLNAVINDNTAKSEILFSMIQEQIRYYGINGIEDAINQFNEISTDINQKNQVNNLYQSWQSLGKGKPAPDWIAFDMKGKEFNLTSFKGKYVYVDVWATWCGPCKREIPFLEELQEQYHSNNKIAFASISVDRNKDAWEKMVKDKNLGGYQLHTTGTNHQQLSTNYRIKGIPRFMLFDPSGKIVNVNAPRPSSKELPLVIENLLGKG